MFKRFTDIDKWDDPWYWQMPREYRDLWNYLVDKCDAAGVWKVDFETVNHYLKFNFDPIVVLEYFNNGKDRIRQISGGKKWLIEGFIAFQYGRLSDKCAPHGRVFECLELSNLEYFGNRVLDRVSDTLSDRAKTRKEEDKKRKEDDFSVSKDEMFCFKTIYKPDSLKNHLLGRGATEEQALDIIEKVFGKQSKT